MSKPKQTDTPRITIRVGDDAPEPDTTLIDLLRSGEKGTLADRLGARVRAFLVHQHNIADKRRGAVDGKITITFDTSTGPDGDMQYAVDVTTKEARMPVGTSTAFTDDDGDLLSRPASRDKDEPLTDYINRKAGSETKAEPVVGKASNL